MDGITLERVVRQDPHADAQFAGVFASDTLPRTLKCKPALLIANLDPISKPGSHWVAIRIGCDGKGEYFDSYGLPPYVPKLRRYLDRKCRSWRYNTVDLQALNSTVCGQYCAMFVLFRAHGYTMQNFVNKYFTEHCQKNDRLVYSMFKRYSRNVKLCDDVHTKKTQVCCERKKK